MLDSRAIGPGDCFAKRLSRVGIVKYRLVQGAGSRLRALGATFTISVTENNDPQGTRLRHAIGVRREGVKLLVDQPALLVARGDTVVWYGKDATVGGFVIKGIYGSRTFDSSRLKAESMYTHAFGTPGEYRWADAYGSGISGVVTVRSPAASIETTTPGVAAAARLRGTLVRVGEDGATPRHVELITGQTVFWAVEDAPGISITDARLLGRRSEQPRRRGRTHRLGRRAS